MDKTNFLLYKDFKPNIDILSNEQAGKLFKAVFAYVQDRTEPNFENDGMLLMAFTMLKTTLERDLKKYKKQVEINKVNGKKGGRPPNKDKETQSVNDKPNKPSGLNENRNNPSEPKKADSDSVTDSVSDRERDKKDKDTMSSKHDHVPYKEIVSYLNDKTNSKYKSTTSKTKTLIKARFNEGFTTNDFKKVIDIKSNEWLNDKDMKKYLRPETLFGTKFESYLNQEYKGNNSTKSQEIQDWIGI